MANEITEKVQQNVPEGKKSRLKKELEKFRKQVENELKNN
jgi:hypothetical protein